MVLALKYDANSRTCLIVVIFIFQSLLAPLAALTLLWNMLFSTVLLKEELGKRDIAATFTIFFGTVLSVVFAKHSDPDYDVEILKALWFEPRMTA